MTTTRIPRPASWQRRAAVVGMIAAVTLIMGACGDDDDSDATETSNEPEASPATELVVVMDPGDGEAEEWTLTCSPTGGTHPDPDGACAALDGLDADVMAPVPEDAMCTMIHGGPHTATITGRWDGDDIDVAFSRENGCEIARWDAVVDLVQNPGNGTIE